MTGKGPEDSLLKETAEKLMEVERKVTTGGWSEDVTKERLRLISKLWKGLRREEHQRQQKSRVQWLRDGDKNAKFFHAMFQAKRRNNFLGDLVINGESCKEPSTIREGIFRHFKEQYNQDSWSRPNLGTLVLPKLE